jgi:chorismate synthase
VNTFGDKFRISLFGSSHGNLVGVFIEGLPPGIEIDVGQINLELSRRAPGQSKVTTDRKEIDNLIVETGLFNGKSSGEPFVAFVRNKDVDSSYYDEIKSTPRPGHADYPAFIKYKGSNDYRGGGQFSGRMTIGLVIAGSIAKQILSRIGVNIQAYTLEIGGIRADPILEYINSSFIYSTENIVRVANPESINLLVSEIEQAKEKGDSVGGIVQCEVQNLPVGVGEPIFDSIESRISHIVFSIPATKGVEFGSGFSAAKMHGSEHNDEYYFENNKIKTKTNNAGGILGGLSNGMPVVFRVAVKPTSSISKTQDTVNLEQLADSKLNVRGRHDPCIVPRVIPVLENATAIVILDLILMGNFLSDVI